MNLTDGQQQAYDSLYNFCTTNDADEKMAVLCGYAGTGKTTLIAKLVDEISMSCRIAIAAPTNKAVAVLKEKLDSDFCDFGSIHSFLGLRMKEKEDGTQDCQPEGSSKVHEYNLIIIDECSMINTDIFKRIALSLRERTKVIFVGDPAQLPPVGEKQESPVFRMVSKKLMLSEVVRQAAENPIIGLSMKLREFIEMEKSASPQDVQDSIPEDARNACVTPGGDSTIINWSLHELESKRDSRIVAFTNRKVVAYNRRIHELIYGEGSLVYCPGETVIVHEQTEAKTDTFNKPVTLHTNEELEVCELEESEHPKFPEIPSYMIRLKRESGEFVWCYIPQEQEYLEGQIGKAFNDWRNLKSETSILKSNGDSNWLVKDAETKKASRTAWAMKKSYASIRHSYAITAHKSQGSTFDTAIIDYSDIARMKNAFDFNRALYVAVTRPRSYLAIVV